MIHQWVHILIHLIQKKKQRSTKEMVSLCKAFPCESTPLYTLHIVYVVFFKHFPEIIQRYYYTHISQNTVYEVSSSNHIYPILGIQGW